MKNEQLTHDTFLHHLNEPQQQAVLHESGPLLVIAGAGSGKTRVITSRIMRLLSKNTVIPQQIVALTFTNKAAGEMKERIAAQHGHTRSLFIGTFHSYCLYLLKVHSARIGYETFSILDADDQLQLITSILKKTGSQKRYSPKNLMHQISLLKCNDYHQDRDAFMDPFVKQVLVMYEHEKKLSKCFDFDDLLLQILQLFKTDSSFKEFHQQAVRHLLVDEYQDTNRVQHELLKQMALTPGGNFAIDSLCAVGDEDQSIYSWRGATVANILEFKTDFPDTKMVTIAQNYRSAEPILQVANHIIKYNLQRTPKQLWSTKEGADRVRIVTCVSSYQEGELIAHGIKQLRTHQQLNSIALLYRAHYQSRTLEEALIRHSIPYVIIGGIQFYERKEIKDLLAYVRLLVNPFDRVAFARIINCPNRGLGDVFVEEFFAVWDQQPFWQFYEVANHLIEQSLIVPSKRTALKQFIHNMNSCSTTSNAHNAIEQLIKKIDYFDYVKHAFDLEQAQEKIENCKELLRATKHFDDIGISSITDFLAQVTLMQEKAQKNEGEQRVHLMTLHAAKGLEFDTVMLTGLEEGIFPSPHAQHQLESIEEERRLLYVGITRARERLLITHVRYRSSFGTTTDQVASRFLSEMPDHLAQRADASFWHEHQLKQFFSNWLGTTTAVKTHIRTFGTKTEPEKSTAPAQNVRAATVACTFQLNQPIKHAKFGIGIIKHIDQRTDDDIVITAQFKTGLKKIKSSFVEKI